MIPWDTPFSCSWYQHMLRYNPHLSSRSISTSTSPSLPPLLSFSCAFTHGLITSSSHIITSLHLLASHIEQCLRIDMIMHARSQHHMIVPLYGNRKHRKHISHTAMQSHVDDTDSESGSENESDVEIDT